MTTVGSGLMSGAFCKSKIMAEVIPLRGVTCSRLAVLDQCGESGEKGERSE
jgi:hypothetical protein